MNRDQWFAVMSYRVPHAVSPGALHGGWAVLTRGHANRKNQHIGTATAGPPANQQRSGALGGGGGGQVSKRVPGDKLAILSDSSYLILGAQGQVHSWHEMLWIGTGGGG